jgi:hypothetical protein
MKLVHHSPRLLLGPLVSYLLGDPAPGHLKPRGFWVSVEGDDDWKSWCKAEGFALDRLEHTYDVQLAETASILRLKSAEDIDTFTKEYGVTILPNMPRMGMGIDWSRVAARYQGLIIAPYIWDRRLTSHTFWYYGWDCASGCIWDVSAIASLVLREEVRDEAGD